MSAYAASRPQRPIPDDFEVIFVEQGRVDCEHWYRARRTTINRWLEECGKDRLIARRAKFVAHERKARRRKSEAARARARAGHSPSQANSVRIDLPPADALPMELLRRAADHLRCVRNGGWTIMQVPGAHLWLVGRVLRTSAELVAKAQSKGFNPHAARAHIDQEKVVLCACDEAGPASDRAAALPDDYAGKREG